MSHLKSSYQLSHRGTPGANVQLVHDTHARTHARARGGMMPKTQRHREELLENLRSGMSIVAACALASVSRSSYYNWIKDADFNEEAQAAIRFGEAVHVARISTASVDDWRASAWFLERRFPNEWGPKQELNLQTSNQDGGASLVVAMIEQTDERTKQLEESGDG